MNTRLKFTYNSLAAGTAIQYGSGVADLFNPTVTAIDTSTARLIDGVGAPFTYTGKTPMAGNRHSRRDLECAGPEAQWHVDRNAADGMAGSMTPAEPSRNLTNPSGGALDDLPLRQPALRDSEPDRYADDVYYTAANNLAHAGCERPHHLFHIGRPRPAI